MSSQSAPLALPPGLNPNPYLPKSIFIYWADLRSRSARWAAFDLLTGIGDKLRLVYDRPQSARGVAASLASYRSSRGHRIVINFKTSHVAELELVGRI